MSPELFVSQTDSVKQLSQYAINLKAQFASDEQMTHIADEIMNLAYRVSIEVQKHFVNMGCQ